MVEMSLRKLISPKMSSLPISGHWAPWPLNTMVTAGAFCGVFAAPALSMNSPF